VKRRNFITLLLGGAVAGGLLPQAQMPTISLRQ